MKDNSGVRKLERCNSRPCEMEKCGFFGDLEVK